MKLYKYIELNNIARGVAFYNFKKEVRFFIKAKSVAEIDRKIENLLIKNDYRYDIKGNIIN